MVKNWISINFTDKYIFYYNYGSVEITILTKRISLG